LEGPVAEAARGLFDALSGLGLRLVCAESCTGGMITAALTDLPGSSGVLWGGIAAYSNQCKSRVLGVPTATIAEFGAVSREVARAMAEGALGLSGSALEGGASLALAVTGIAGPEGGSAEKPVGLVWFAFRREGGPAYEESLRFEGYREAVREAAAAHAMRRATELTRGIGPASGRY
jgi:nicotinamide-nucleotide amidase